MNLDIIKLAKESFVKRHPILTPALAAGSMGGILGAGIGAVAGGRGSRLLGAGIGGGIGALTGGALGAAGGSEVMALRQRGFESFPDGNNDPNLVATNGRERLIENEEGLLLLEGELIKGTFKSVNSFLDYIDSRESK